jgi:hypothetical protein
MCVNPWRMAAKLKVIKEALIRIWHESSSQAAASVLDSIV